jgi:hypothetical protein
MSDIKMADDNDLRLTKFGKFFKVKHPWWNASIY